MKKNGTPFGELLNEYFAKDILSKYIKKGFFYLLAPNEDCFVLYTNQIFSKDWEEIIDDMLRQNVDYDYYRKIDQLKCLKIFQLFGNPEEEYQRGISEFAQQVEDMEVTVLSFYSGWDLYFVGFYL